MKKVYYLFLGSLIILTGMSYWGFDKVKKSSSCFKNSKTSPLHLEKSEVKNEEKNTSSSTKESSTQIYTQTKEFDSIPEEISDLETEIAYYKQKIQDNDGLDYLNHNQKEDDPKRQWLVKAFNHLDDLELKYIEKKFQNIKNTFDEHRRSQES